MNVLEAVNKLDKLRQDKSSLNISLLLLRSGNISHGTAINIIENEKIKIDSEIKSIENKLTQIQLEAI